MTAGREELGCPGVGVCVVVWVGFDVRRLREAEWVERGDSALERRDSWRGCEGPVLDLLSALRGAHQAPFGPPNGSCRQCRIEIRDEGVRRPKGRGEA